MLRYTNYPNQEKSVIEVHIADIHFGAIDPEVQYDILRDQFITPISNLNFNILSIDGDLFDKKFLANNPAVTYAIRFVMDCIQLCMLKQATMIVIAGTQSHDAGQLSMFKRLTDDDNFDFRIVEQLQFEYAQGLKILCVPEEYGKSLDYYTDKLLNNTYDTVFMHGTFVGSVYGANRPVMGGSKAPVFNLNTFAGCMGPIIAGHVHNAACYEQYMYHVSNPIRYRFGEEAEKGYSIVLHSPKGHLYKFMPIHSFRYDTVKIKDIEYIDPTGIISYTDALKKNGIDYIRLDLEGLNDEAIQSVLVKAYSDDPRIQLKIPSNNKTLIKEVPVQEDKFSGMGFLMDQSIDNYQRFVDFVNYNEGKVFITVDQLKNLLK